AVLEAVASGRADVGGTYCQVDAEGKLASGPWEARTYGPALVALAVTEPVPPDVLCTAPGAPSALVARLRKALLAVDAEAEATAPLLRRMHARGFATPHPERYRRPGPGQA
ncbi:MAG: PhnD/SsuA/transferrin family substrate-binding protein, partial [Myxococcota bacterium]